MLLFLLSPCRILEKRMAIEIITVQRQEPLPWKNGATGQSRRREGIVGQRREERESVKSAKREKNNNPFQFLSLSHLSVQMLPLGPSRTSEPPEALVISSALKMTPPSSSSQEEVEEEVTTARLFLRTVDDAAEERSSSFDDADEEEAVSEAAFLIARCWKGVAPDYVCREALLQWYVYYSHSLSRVVETPVCA